MTGSRTRNNAVRHIAIIFDTRRKCEILVTDFQIGCILYSNYYILFYVLGCRERHIRDNMHLLIDNAYRLCPPRTLHLTFSVVLQTLKRTLARGGGMGEQ